MEEGKSGVGVGSYLYWIVLSGVVSVVFIYVLFFRESITSSSLKPTKEAQKKQHAKHLSSLRRSLYPPAFPNGWYPLLNTEQLKVNEIQRVNALGHQFIVFRSQADSTASVLDAFCPHNGADLSIGDIKDGCVQCPFHLWKFNEEGKCVSIPYLNEGGTIPKTAHTRAWPVSEYFGYICIFFHADFLMEECNQNQKLEPLYPLHTIPEMDIGSDLVFYGKTERVVKMHIEEFAENAADFQHFGPLHGKMLFPWTSTAVPGVTINHKANWFCGEKEEDKHLSWFSDEASLNFFGRAIPRTSASAQITFIGPGGIVVFKISIPDVGRVFIIQTHLPHAPFEQCIRFRWFAEKSVSRLIVWYVVGNWIAAWRSDIDVWETKVYAKRPSLVRGDGPIMKLRRWYSQFYCENSRKVLLQNNLEW